MTGAAQLRRALEAARASGAALVGEAIGVHGVTQGFVGENLHLTPLSEAGSLGVAVGLALAGQRVVLEWVDAGALARAQAILADALLRHPNLPLVIRMPEPSALPVGLPSALTVWIAGDASGLAANLTAALQARRPTLLLEPAGLRLAEVAGEGAGEAVAGGASVVRQAGERVTLLAAGSAVEAALAGAAGIDGVEVVALGALQPLDAAAIRASVRKTGRCVWVGHGVPAPLLTALDEGFFYLESPLAACVPSAVAVARAIHQRLEG